MVVGAGRRVRDAKLRIEIFLDVRASTVGIIREMYEDGACHYIIRRRIRRVFQLSCQEQVLRRIRAPKRLGTGFRSR
jgi:hypothetical protein